MLIPLLFAYWHILRFLGDPDVSWQLVEVNKWKLDLVAWGFPVTLSDIAHALNWELFEWAPRVTRPLSNVIELFDTPFRATLWKYWPIPPSLSLTWPVSLIFAPLLLFRLLRLLGVETWIATLAVALYVGNPGVMSLEVMMFRPGKGMADAAIILCLYRAAGLDNIGRESPGPSINRSFAWLCTIMVLSFFLDETALMSYPAVALFFPRLVFGSRIRALCFACILPMYYDVVSYGMPILSALAGYPLDSVYGPQAQMVMMFTSALPMEAYKNIWTNLIGNSYNILVDSFGLIPPQLANSPYYLCVFLTIIASAAACMLMAVQCGCRYFPRWRTHWREYALGDSASARLWRALIMLLLALAYEGLLMTVSNNGGFGARVWGLYYYGVFCVVFLVIAIALLFQVIRAPLPLATIFALAVVSGTTFIFPATNQAYKSAHYYPYNPSVLERVFANKVNRFQSFKFDPGLLQSKTRELWNARLTHQPIYNVPGQLSYMTYEMGTIHYKFYPGLYFDLLWEDGVAHVYCHN